MQSIRKYYRTYNESHEGTPGLFYCEVNNGMITRMINSFEHELWWATPSAHNNEQYESPRLSWRPVGLSHAAVLAD